MPQFLSLVHTRTDSGHIYNQGVPKIVSGPPKTAATPPSAEAKKAGFYRKPEGDFQLNFRYSIRANGEALAAGPKNAVEPLIIHAVSITLSMLSLRLAGGRAYDRPLAAV